MADSNQILSKNLVYAWEKGETEFTLQTSGSTGVAKTMILQKEKAIWSCHKTAEFLNIRPTDSIYCCLPVNRIGGWMQVVRALVWHVPIKVVEPTSNPFINYNENYTITSLTPMQLFTILENPESVNNLNRFRIVLIGGGDISTALESRLQGLQPTFYHTYGMTETYSHIAMRKMNEDSFFEVFPDTEIKIGNNDCLAIKNYLTNNEWIETNDIVELNADGFKIIGRADNIINSGGIKINPEEIEKMLSSKLNLPEGSFFYGSVADEKYGEKTVLFVNHQIISELPEWEYLFQNQAHTKPKEIRFLENFIYTETGKIQRNKTKLNQLVVKK